MRTLLAGTPVSTPVSHPPPPACLTLLQALTTAVPRGIRRLPQLPQLPPGARRASRLPAPPPRPRQAWQLRRHPAEQHTRKIKYNIIKLNKINEARGGNSWGQGWSGPARCPPTSLSQQEQLTASSSPSPPARSPACLSPGEPQKGTRAGAGRGGRLCCCCRRGGLPLHPAREPPHLLQQVSRVT